MRAEPHLTFLEHLPQTQVAVQFALERHAGQRRAADNAAFLLHTLEVASLLDRSGYPDHVIAAAVLHDVLEKTDAERSEVEARFGAEVAELVESVSDDPSMEDEEERKDELRERVRAAGGYSAAVYAADKVSKARELRTLLVAGTPREEVEGIVMRHRKSLEMLDATIPGSRLTEVLRFELEALEDLPPDV
jgi:(p)ppGpp synthase/HD superfamily hydrolase